MNENSLKKKAPAIVLHQMFLILTICSLYAMDYFIVHDFSMQSIVCSIMAVIGLLCSFVALAFLTNIVENGHWIDKIPSDLLTAIFIILVWTMMHLILRFRHETFSFAGLLVAIGTMTYLADIGFLAFYLSIVRRIKGNTLLSESILNHVYLFFKRLIKKNPDATYVLPLRRNIEQMQIQQALDAIAEGELDTLLELSEFHGRERKMAEAVNRIREGLREAVSQSTKNERMKADLITNVSHDIKTPLTSIVNYIDLLKRENLQNENAHKYLRILDEKSQRLKHLAEDLVEASKISSGNIALDMQEIDFVELIYQTGGEYNEKFEEKELTIVTKLPKKAVKIYADGRRLHRAIENLYTNAAKYALEKTRVYVELSIQDDIAVFSMKNVSKNPISLEEGNDLTARFVRGEVSRTTEGSGLGLSIAKNLTTLMGGDFEINTDDDMFIAMLSFKML